MTLSKHTFMTPEEFRSHDNAINPNRGAIIHNLLGMESRFRLGDNIINHNRDLAVIDNPTQGIAYWVTKENIFTYFSLPRISHEIAHLLEMKNSKRWVLPDFGIKFPFNHTHKNKSIFFTALARETRVIAIESVLSSNSKSILDNSSWKIDKRYLPFGRFNKKSDLKDWIIDLHTKTVNAWSHDRIYHEWAIRLDYIKNWMETKN